MSDSSAEFEHPAGGADDSLLEIEAARARAEAEAAALKAKALALEAELERRRAQSHEPAPAPAEHAAPAPTSPTPAAPKQGEPAGRGQGPPRLPSSATARAPTKRAPRPAAARSRPDGRPGARTEAGAAAQPAAPSRPAETSSPAHRPAERPAAEKPASKQPAPDESAPEPKADRDAAGAEPARTRRSMLMFQASGGYLVSMIVNCLAMIVLGIWYLPPETVADRNPLMALAPDEIQEIERLEEELIEIEELQGFDISVEDPGLADLGEMPGIDAPEYSDFSSDLSNLVTDPGAPFGLDGDGWATAGDGRGGAEFYGVRARGRRFVFIVDNSLSMNNGRFESACYELVKTVDRMERDQEFYVFFFSDTAYGLFYPNAARSLVPATQANKQRLQAWLYLVELVLKTNAHSAVEEALRMNPDAIYILTDGAFTDDTARFLMKLEPGRTAIHTVGMEIEGKAEKTLQDIAARHHGSYRHVRTDPRMRMIAAKSPRKRHNKRGPVWGIALPNEPPKRKKK